MKYYSVMTILSILSRRGFFCWVPTRLFLKCKYRLCTGKKLNLKQPQTFNEKLQWLKLYYAEHFDPLYTSLADKIKAKIIVAGIIGEEYIIPTLGTWNQFDDIDFDDLPNQFVLKTNHDSGGVVVVSDKTQMNKEAARRKLEKSLRLNFYWYGREPQYRDIQPKIFAEKYIANEGCVDLKDYKFFNFNGEPKLMFIASDRQTEGRETTFDFFDMDFNLLDFTNGHPHAAGPVEKPVCFEEMKRLSAKLSAGFPQLRVDFYEVDGRVYFGEITFFHWSGMKLFDPEEWDHKLGGWIELPSCNEC